MTRTSFPCAAASSAAVSAGHSSRFRRPSPAAFISSKGMKRSAAEVMQNLFPPRSTGPSSKTCPRWESAPALRTSTRFIPWDESPRRDTASGAMLLEKAGQPYPESNLSLEENRGFPLTTST